MAAGLLHPWRPHLQLLAGAKQTMLNGRTNQTNGTTLCGDATGEILKPPKWSSNSAPLHHNTGPYAKMPAFKMRNCMRYFMPGGVRTHSHKADITVFVTNTTYNIYTCTNTYIQPQYTNTNTNTNTSYIPLRTQSRSLIPSKSTRSETLHVQRDWQRSWDQTRGNNLNAQSKLGRWHSGLRKSRAEEVSLCRLRIGHTYATHRYLLCGEERLRCPRCAEVLTRA